MKFSKNLALMSLGAGAVVLYQKYNKPLMKKVEQVVGKVTKKEDNELENMM